MRRDVCISDISSTPYSNIQNLGTTTIHGYRTCLPFGVVVYTVQGESPLSVEHINFF